MKISLISSYNFSVRLSFQLADALKTVGAALIPIIGEDTFKQLLSNNLTGELLAKVLSLLGSIAGPILSNQGVLGKILAGKGLV